MGTPNEINIPDVQIAEKKVIAIKKSYEQAKTAYQDALKELEILRGNNRKVVTDVQGKPLKVPLYMDGYLKSNLNITQELVDKDFDNIGLIVGYEGSGKSMLAMQIAYYLDSGFKLDNIVFNKSQFEEMISKADKLPKNNPERPKVIVWDEADDLSRNWNDSITFTLKRLGKRVRKLNLHILIVTPTFFDMSKYWSIMRTRYLIEPYTLGTERGYFRFFNRKDKRLLYIYGKKEWNMAARRETFKGRFLDLPEGFPIDKEAYENKKSESSFQDDSHSEKMQRLDVWKVKYRRDVVENMRAIMPAKYDIRVSRKDMAEILGVSEEALKRDLKAVVKLKEKAEYEQIRAFGGAATSGNLRGEGGE